MKNFIVIITLFASISINSQELSTEQWREDIEFFNTELVQNHKSPYNFISEQEFIKIYQDFYNNIPNLTTNEIMVGLIKLAASIGDGHTNIRPYDQFNSFPVRFYWFGEKLKIIKTDPNHQELLGGEVVKIGNYSVSKANNKIKDLIPANESPTFLLGWSQAMLRMAEVLKTREIIKNKEVLPLKIKFENGKSKTVKIYLDEKSKQELVSVYKNPPRFLKDRSKPYFEWLSEEKKILYFNFETYPEWKDFEKFGMGLIGFIAKNKVEMLVVDLRLNGGGDFKKGLRLIEEINKRTDFVNEGETYVIIGRDTFSAGMSNVAHFKQKMNATLIGETTGARPNGYQENHSIVLPNSKIPASIAKEYYIFSDKNTSGIIPDIEILPNYKLYLKGQDPVINWLLKELR